MSDKLTVRISETIFYSLLTKAEVESYRTGQKEFGDFCASLKEFLCTNPPPQGYDLDVNYVPRFSWNKKEEN